MNGWNPELQTYDLSLSIAQNILKYKHKQAERVLITGQIGHGKSATALSLAYNIACHISIYKYGTKDRWQEFFNPTENIACIDPTAMMRLMQNATKPLNIYILDDVGAGGWQSRRFMSKQNQTLNNIFSTQRVFRNVLICTVQAERMIDAQARLLFTRYIEMSGPQAYDYGVNFGKLFNLSLRPREKNGNNTYFIYPRYKNVVYDTIAVLSPPQEIMDMYDELREKELIKLIENGQEKEDEEESIIDSDRKSSKKDQILEFIAKNQPPENKKELMQYRRAVAKDLQVTENFIYKVMKDIL